MVISNDGKNSITEYIVENSFQDKKKQIFSVLDVRILTGRTHQIRVHLCSLGTPIVGDPIYSSKSAKHQVDYLLLASKLLKFKHPITGNEMLFKLDPLPPHIVDYLSQLNEKCTIVNKRDE